MDPEGVAESGVEAEGIGGVAGGGAGVGGIGGVSRCAGFNRSKETVLPTIEVQSEELVSSLHHSEWPFVWPLATVCGQRRECRWRARR